MIPLPTFHILNSDFLDRDIITDKVWTKKVKAKYFEKLEAFSFRPFQESLYSTDQFDSWWSKNINSV